MDNHNPIKFSDLISPDNSIEILIKQLTEAQRVGTEAIKAIRAEAAQLADELKNVSGATETGRQTTRKAASDADRLAKAEKELEFSMSEQAKELAKLNLAKKEQNQLNRLIVKLNNSAEGSYDRLSAQYSINKIRLNAMTAAERENTEAGKLLEKQTREIYEEMKRLQEATGKFQLNVGNYPGYEGAQKLKDSIAGLADNMGSAVGVNNDLFQSLMQLGKGGEASKAVFTAMGDGAKALGRTLLGLLSNPVFLAIAGIAAAGAAFKWWYDYNAGLVEATRLTQQFTGKSGDDLKAFRNEVTAVANAFNKDFNEVLIAANAMAKQFGISVNDALQNIEDGFAAGGDVTGEMLDNIKEYSAYFKEAGLSAEQFTAIVVQTNKAGIFSDKGIDAIKEANLRLREMTTATAAALDGIGISSVQVQKDLQTGAKTTFQVMQDVSAKLNELPDSATQVGTAIADIFGGPGEDAGLQFLRTLKDISTNMEEVKAQSGELGQIQQEVLQSEVELQNTLAGLFDATGGTFERLNADVKIFANNVLTWLIKQLINVVNLFIDLYNNSLLVRGIFESISAAIKTVGDVIANVFKAAVEILSGFGQTIAGVLTLDWDKMNEGASRVLKALPNMVKNIVKDTGENLVQGFKNMNRKIKPITIPVTTTTETDTTPTKAPVTTKKPKVTGDSGAGKAAEQAAKAAEQSYKKNLEATRKLQDAQLKLESDEYKRRRQQTLYEYDRQIEDLQHQLQTEKDLDATGRQAITAQMEVLEKQKTEALLAIERERQLKELELQQQGIQLRLAAAKKGSEEEMNLRLQLNETQRQSELLKNQAKPAGERQSATDINAKFDVSKSAITDEYLNAQLAIFDQQQALAESEFNLLRNSEARKTQFRLQAEKARLQKILELNQKAANKLSDTEVATIQNTIKEIDQEIEKSKGEERGTDIYGLFGLNLDDDQKEAISTSMSYALDALNTFTEARVAAADAAKEQADKEVDAAQSALDAELEARANGYANNVAQAQKELDLAKKNQQKAIKEQQKAQKQQAAIQTLQQIGNMVTATALIWSQLGFPLAIPAIAVMWASFAASKIKAAQLAKTQAGGEGGTEQYGEGTVELLQGGSHQSGNDIDLGTKPDGTRRRAEGGEFFSVINKRNSRRFRKFIPDVINSLNNGTFAHKYLNAYGGDNGVSINVGTNNAPDLRQLENDVREIKEQHQRRYYTDSRGNTVVAYKNLVRKIKQ